MSDRATEPQAQRRILRGILKTLRPYQWVKNIFVLAPLFFSKAFLVPELLAKELAAALLFSLTAGAVYLMNDIFDVEKDRNHPIKKNRPIAKGELPIGVARTAAAVIAPGSIACAFLLDWRAGSIILAYFIMNFAYSVKLKHVPYFDVMIIAAGFVMRVMAGAWAINVAISSWLVICTFLLALYLALGKRMNELRLVELGRADKVRKVLKHYNSEQLNFAVLFVGGLTIATYTIYTLSAALPDQPMRSVHTPFASPYLPGTIPFTVFGISRFYLLLLRETDDSPTDLILRDKPFLVNMALWMLGMVILYFSA